MSLEQFFGKLFPYNVDLLIDVRSIPYSRYSDQYNKDQFKRSCEKQRIDYLWRGNYVGGIKKNIDWDQGIEEIVDRANQGSVIVIMCSESNPFDCHRAQKITPDLGKHEIKVIHLPESKRQNRKKSNFLQGSLSLIW